MLSGIPNSTGSQDMMRRLPFFYWGSCEILQLTCHLMDHVLVAQKLIRGLESRPLGVEHGGHEATETGLAYAPVSQAHGHNHIVQCFACCTAA